MPSKLSTAEPQDENAKGNATISMRAGHNALTARRAMVLRVPGSRISREVASMFARWLDAFGDTVDRNAVSRRDRRKFGV
jgi:hypothetical protein